MRLKPFRLPETPFHRMRLAATLLLLGMALLFVSTLRFEDAHPALPWVKAFAEAALVGGLADWFAVTALFRHPLGLPIPHTAIIPANKDRIGDSLASFLKDNFLTPSVLARRLHGVDIAGAAAAWLAAPGSPPLTGQPATGPQGLGPLIAKLIRLLDTPHIGELVKAGTADRLRAMALSPLVADAVDTTLDRRRHVPVLDAGLDWALAMLDDQQSTIREMVKDRTNWLLRAVNIDTRVSDQLIEGIRSLLTQIAADPEHPLRARLEVSLRGWADSLRNDPEARLPVEAFKRDLIDNPALGQWIGSLWDSARAGLVKRLDAPASAPDSRLVQAFAAIGQRIEADPMLRASLNTQLRRLGVGLVNRYGQGIVGLVSATVRGWDATTVTNKLESAVGRDLQFIRINGTLIGGCIGLALHALVLAVR
ncbi:DUF445 domain-containing protein [Polymorphobacter sp.]|uniref:DUF445 domain-containing protein n=1 Tax=Polymorphobacter sp. TaxID=1909290 RepID=UPI003F71A2B2